MKKLKKLLFKWIIPQPKDIAKLVATGAADFINSTNKQEAIATFMEKSKSFQDAQFLVTKWLADGKIDEAEKVELEEKLVPICELVYTRIMKKVEGQP